MAKELTQEEIDAQNWLDDYIEEVKKNNISKLNGGQYPLDEEIRYVIYARKSSKPEKKQHDSPEEQIAECIKYATENKLKYVAVLKESASAFKSTGREVYTEMMEEIQKPTGRIYNAILAWAPDRLARNMKDGGDIIDLLDKNIIRDVKFPKYYFVNDANGKLSLGIQFVIAKQHSENDSISTRRGNRTKLSKGHVLKVAPWCYKILVEDTNRKLVVDEKNYSLFRQALLDIIAGKPLKTVAIELNEKGFEYQNGYKNVTEKKLSQQLSKPIYAGYYIVENEVFNYNEIVPDFKSILSAFEFRNLRLRLQEKAGRMRQKRSSVQVFRKLIECSYCKRHLTPTKNKNRKEQKLPYIRLVCTNKHCQRYNKSIRFYQVFDFIDLIMQKYLSIPESAYKTYLESSKSSLHNELKEIEEKITSKSSSLNQIKIKLQKTLELYQKVSSPHLEATFKKFSVDITDLEGQLQILEGNKEKLKAGMKNRLLTYEEFLNTIENINNNIQKHENQELVDTLTKMVFLNITVDSEKVVSYQLKPPFEEWVKLPTILSGVDYGKKLETNFFLSTLNNSNKFP